MRKHRLVEGLVQDQLGDAPPGAPSELIESGVYKRSKAAPASARPSAWADIAYILEALPLDERLYIWDLVKAERDGEILLEVSDAVRESLISSMDTEELVAATETLEADEIAELAPDLPQEVMDDVFQSLPVEEREQLRAAMSFEDDMVGALMDFEDVAVLLEVLLPKTRIFELYLNVIEWGNGVYGAEAAARHYFGASAAQLSSSQAARLAAMAPNPRFYERNQGAPGLMRKIDIILARMPSAEVP